MVFYLKFTTKTFKILEAPVFRVFRVFSGSRVFRVPSVFGF